MDKPEYRSYDSYSGNTTKELCNPWCAPLYVFIFLSLIQMLSVFTLKRYNYETSKHESFAMQEKFGVMVVLLMWNLLFGGIIYYLCKYCYKTAAWFIVLLPIILNALFTLMVLAYAIWIIKKTTDMTPIPLVPVNSQTNSNSQLPFIPYIPGEDTDVPYTNQMSKPFCYLDPDDYHDEYVCGLSGYCCNGSKPCCPGTTCIDGICQ